MPRTGRPWRSPPNDPPTDRTRSHNFRAWHADGTRAAVHAAQRETVRRASGERRRPTTGVLDGQTARTAEWGGPRRHDGGRRLVGRERHLVVDTLGLVWAVAVTPARVQDGDGGRAAMLRAELAHPGLRRVFADSAHGACRFRAAQFARVIVWVVRKPPGPG